MHLTVDGRDVYAYTGTRPFDAARPTALFVHGAANDHSVWALQSRYFAHHGWNVLALDLPGHGRSGGEALAAVEAIGDWIASVVDACGARAASLVGHSLGSLAVLEATARHPDRVERVALLGPAYPMPVSDVLQDAAKANEHLAFELINSWSWSPGKQFGGNTLPGVWLTGNGMRLMERTRPGVLYADLMACHNYRRGLDAAAAVRCPALVIAGARDLMVPARDAQALIATLPAARAVMLQDCGHSMMAEQPDAVLDALKGFLSAS